MFEDFKKQFLEWGWIVCLVANGMGLMIGFMQFLDSSTDYEDGKYVHHDCYYERIMDYNPYRIVICEATRKRWPRLGEQKELKK